MPDFEELYERYFPDVFRYALRLTGDEALAEEITSDTFFRAMRSLDGFRGDCDVRVWLCQIAKNRYYTHLRRSGRTEPLEDHEELPDEGGSVEEQAARADEARQIRAILHGIPEPYREVFLWRVYAELGFREIGQLFGKSENWACVTYHRARAMIRKEFQKESGGERT